MQYRLRHDNDGKDIYVVDAHQAMFGTKNESISNSFTKISEERVAPLILPFENIKLENNDKIKTRVFVKTRNYIGYNDVHQATYVDCRFMGFWNNGKELI